jgi:hypothetical protein
MYIRKKFALKKTRLHSDDSSDTKAYCEKGTVYYQISNGTIGKGARSYNMSEKAMQELINSKASNWNKNGYIELEEVKSNVIQFPKKEVEYSIEADRLFTYDDIPF